MSQHKINEYMIYLEFAMHFYDKKISGVIALYGTCDWVILHASRLINIVMIWRMWSFRCGELSFGFSFY